MANRPAVGVRILFDGLVALTMARRSRPDRRALAEAQTRGAEGVYQFEVGARAWHLHVGPGTVRWRSGSHPAPRAVVAVSADDLFRLLTGQTSFVVASMTGRVKVRGDAHVAVLFGLLVARLRAMRDEPRLRGRVVRAWLDLAAHTSGTSHRFPATTRSS